MTSLGLFHPTVLFMTLSSSPALYICPFRVMNTQQWWEIWRV